MTLAVWPASLYGASRIKSVVAARITESPEAATASEKRFNKRKMMPRTKSGLANHGRYENPNSRQIKPKRKLESPLLNINVLKPVEVMNKLIERTSPIIRSINEVVSCSWRWRTVWIADAHRGDGKRFVVRADEILTAFLELESATCGKKFNEWHNS